jgi:hypothetical protein
LILGFTISDIEAFVDRVRAAAARPTRSERCPTTTCASPVEDVEGHLIESFS